MLGRRRDLAWRVRAYRKFGKVGGQNHVHHASPSDRKSQDGLDVTFAIKVREFASFQAASLRPSVEPKGRNRKASCGQSE
jgi:hypothetical protein